MSSISGRTTPPVNADAHLYDDDEKEEEENKQVVPAWLLVAAPLHISRPTAAYLNPPGQSGRGLAYANDEALARKMQAYYDATPRRIQKVSEADFKPYPQAKSYHAVARQLRERGNVSVLDALRRVQPQLATLDMLYLANQFVDDKTLPDLLNLMTTTCPNLRYLDLSHNSLTDVSVQAVTDYSAIFNKLIFLNLHGNLFTKQACAKILNAQAQHPTMIPVGIDAFNTRLLSTDLKGKLNAQEARMWAVSRVLHDVPDTPAAIARALNQSRGWINLSETSASEIRPLLRAAAEPMELMKVVASRVLDAFAAVGRIMAPNGRRS